MFVGGLHCQSRRAVWTGWAPEMTDTDERHIDMVMLCGYAMEV
jgi:hypothetical protein